MSVFDDDDKELELDGRAGLEEGAGLEIEDDEAPDSDFGLDSDDETPSWLKSGKGPTWMEIDAEFWAEEGEAEQKDGAQISADDGETSSEDAEETPRKLVVVHESQRTRRTLIIVAAACACVCGISTYMFMNNIGPFAPYIPAEEQPPGETVMPEAEVEAVEWMTAGEGYQDLYELISEQTKGAAGAADGSGMSNLIPLDEYSADGISHNDSDDIYTDANEQDIVIREPDALKTDGSFIYSINSNNLTITRIDGGDMELVSKIPQLSEDELQVYFEMFVAGDRLIALRHGLNRSALQRTPGREDTEIPAMSIWYPFGGEIVDTSVDIFDISDRGRPVKIHTLSQSGTYVSSRMKGDHLYLITTYYGDVHQMKATDPRTFVPLYSRDGEQFTPDESDILIPPVSQWPCYTVIAGVDALGSGDFISLKAVYGDVGTVYSTAEAVYLARMASEETKEPAGTLPPADGTDGPSLDYVENINWSETLITKLTVDSGQVEPRAQVKVPGYVVDQLSLDEYDGVLRLITTVDYNVWYGFKDSRGTFTSDDWARLPAGAMEMSNSLYALDGGLGMIGKIDNIAPDERVNSSRFKGPFAYFTTYNREAPLFSVDLSDPEDPIVTGSMRVQWLSDFLHPYSGGKLFGLGREIDREAGVRQDLKLTMFDNSDPADISELEALFVGNEPSAADYNPKAILVSASKALIAFPTEGKYLIYGYDDVSGFKMVSEILFDSGDIAWTGVRGLIIGDTFYVVSPNDIFAYAVDDGFKRSGSLNIDEKAGPADRWSIIGAAGNTPEEDTLPDGVVLDGNV